MPSDLDTVFRQAGVDPAALLALYERLLGCGACATRRDTLELALRTLGGAGGR